MIPKDVKLVVTWKGSYSC